MCGCLSHDLITKLETGSSFDRHIPLSQDSGGAVYVHGTTTFQQTQFVGNAANVSNSSHTFLKLRFTR